MFGVLKEYAFIIFVMSMLRFNIGFIATLQVPIIPSLFMSFESVNITSNLTIQNITSIQNNTDISDIYKKLSLFYFCDKLVFSLLTPLTGYTLEFVNTRYVLVIGCMLQIVALILYGFSDTFGLLIGAKLFETMFTCLLNTSIDSLNSEMFIDYKIRGFMSSLMKLTFNISASLGPLYGGFIYQYFNQKWAFLSYLISVIPVNFMTFIVLIDYYRKKKLNSNKHCDNDSIYHIGTSMEFTRSCIEIKLTPDEPKLLNKRMSKSAMSLSEELKKLRNKKVVNKVTLKTAFLFLKDPLFLTVLAALPICIVPKAVHFTTLPYYMSLKFKSTTTMQGSVWLLGILGTLIGFFLGNYLNSNFPNNRHVILFINQQILAVCIISIPLINIWWLIALPLCIYVSGQMILTSIWYAILASIVDKRHDSKFGIMSGYIHFSCGISMMVSMFAAPLFMKYFGYFVLNLVLYFISMFYGFLLLFFLKDFINAKQ